jgi:heat shock protein HspQ
MSRNRRKGEFMGRNKFSQGQNVKTSIFGDFPSIVHNISDFFTNDPQEVAFRDTVGQRSNQYQTYIEHETQSTP